MICKNVLTGLAALTFSLSSAEAAQVFNKGDILLCKSTEGMPDVMAWMGEADTTETLGYENVENLGVIYSLQIFGIEGSGYPTVGHSPFSEMAFAECALVKSNVSAPPSADFMEGYNIWKDAARKGEAGFWDQSVADAYWTILGVLPRS